jgi:phage terminase large subunit GpA-like protein
VARILAGDLVNAGARVSEHADINAIVSKAMGAWRPPPRLSLSEWAERYFYLSKESAAEPGRWKSLPYQVGIMDAFTDPRVEQVSVMKSARVGWTKIVNALVGYYLHQAPCPILVVQPTVEDAKGYSKEEIAPMLRDCPELARIIFEDAEDNGPKDSGNTILHKRFPGGVLSLVGANSGTGFRRVSRQVVLFDEVDAYPASAGQDGDPIKLGIKRTEYYWNRKIGAGSTPLIAGVSRIERLFEAGDQRRFYVPCPHCGHRAPLVFRGDAGHAMAWPDGEPDKAYFACQKNGCVIEHKDKREMVAGGEWRAAGEFKGHASFHIWAAYSFSPNADWATLAREFLAAKGDPQQLKVFINTVLGETWQEQGDAPDWERLYAQREDYPIATVPSAVLALTGGVDVQKDRWVYEVVGWGAGKQSWSIEAGVIPGDTSNEAEWAKLDELLARTYPSARGTMTINRLAVDSGFNTNTVYNWARRHPRRVLAVKGVSSAKTILGSPVKVDVTERGRKIARGAMMWPVGVDVAKAELYGWLGAKMPADGDPYPAGYCHFPAYGEDYFKQITAEQLVTAADGRGFTYHEWQVIPGRENHWLDTRVYARAAATLEGLDRMTVTPPATAPPSAEKQAPDTRASPTGEPGPPPRTPPPPRGGFLGRRGDRFPIPGKKGWLR